jgi:Domain of unknown function (DUF4440)
MFALLLAFNVASSDCLRLPAGCGEPDSLQRAALHVALQAFSRAFLKADAEALDTLLTADYLHTNGGTGTVLTKIQWLEFIRGRRAELQSGRLQVARYEATNQEVRWYAGAAVVSTQVVSEGRRDGAAFESRLQVTQVWVRRGDRWWRAAFHDSPLPRS